MNPMDCKTEPCGQIHAGGHLEIEALKSSWMHKLALIEEMVKNFRGTGGRIYGGISL